MCEHNVEPNVRFDLPCQVSELQGTDRLDWRVSFRKRLEEADNTFRDTSLFAAFVNINGWWIEEKNLRIGEFLFFWLLLERLKLRVDGKDGADLEL